MWKLNFKKISYISLAILTLSSPIFAQATTSGIEQELRVFSNNNVCRNKEDNILEYYITDEKIYLKSIPINLAFINDRGNREDLGGIKLNLESFYFHLSDLEVVTQNTNHYDKFKNFSENKSKMVRFAHLNYLNQKTEAEVVILNDINLEKNKYIFSIDKFSLLNLINIIQKEDYKAQYLLEEELKKHLNNPNVNISFSATQTGKKYIDGTQNFYIKDSNYSSSCSWD